MKKRKSATVGSRTRGMYSGCSCLFENTKLCTLRVKLSVRKQKLSAMNSLPGFDSTADFCRVGHYAINLVFLATPPVYEQCATKVVFTTSCKLRYTSFLTLFWSVWSRTTLLHLHLHHVPVFGCNIYASGLDLSGGFGGSTPQDRWSTLPVKVRKTHWGGWNRPPRGPRQRFCELTVSNSTACFLMSVNCLDVMQSRRA